MNFLAHAFLARDDIDLMIGSLMGDFVKGPLDGQYAPSITRGLILHRRVDTYTDSHALVVRSRSGNHCKRSSKFVYTAAVNSSSGVAEYSLQ